MSAKGRNLKVFLGLLAVTDFLRKSVDLTQLSLLGHIKLSENLELSLTSDGSDMLKELTTEFDYPDFAFDRNGMSQEELNQLPDVKLYFRARERVENSVKNLNTTVFDKMYKEFHESWLEYGFFELDGEKFNKYAEAILYGYNLTDQIQEEFLDSFSSIVKDDYEDELEEYRKWNP